MKVTNSQKGGGEAIGESLSETLLRRGWVLVPGSRHDLGLLEIAYELGTPVAPLRRPLVHPLVARSRQRSRAKSLSGIHGLGAFPAHTDVAHWPRPARYVILQCLTNEPSVPTVLLDGRALIDVASSRGWGNTAWKVVNVSRPFCCSILFECSDGPALRWDLGCMIPIDGRGNEVREEFLDMLPGLCRANSETVLLSPRDVLVIDNWRTLHQRPAVPEGKLRVLNRVLVSERTHG